MKRSWFCWSLLVAAVTAMTGCSVLGFAYERADWLALRFANRFVSFDAEQTRELKVGFSARLENHRANELPSYITWLTDVEASLVDGLTAVEAKDLMERLRGLYEKGVEYTVPVIAPTLSTLSPAQIEELAANLEESNHKFYEKYLTPDLDARRAGRFERAAERIAGWTGPLSEAQLALIEQRVSMMPDVAARWYAYRQKKQRELLTLLAGSPDARQLERLLLDWWAVQSDLDEQTRAAGDAWVDAVSELLAELAVTLTAGQRDELLENLDEYRTILANAHRGPSLNELAQRKVEKGASRIER